MKGLFGPGDGTGTFKLPGRGPSSVELGPDMTPSLTFSSLRLHRSVAVEPGNEWFVTGAADRVIKMWDLASGKLKLSLTGHVSTVRGLAVSTRHPYLFSAGEDRQVRTQPALLRY